MDKDTIVILIFALMIFLAMFGFLFLVFSEEFINYKRSENKRKEIIKGEKHE